MSAMPNALELTRQLVAFDTRNPPGDERACADRLGRLLTDAGFAVSAHEFADRRTSLVARRGGADDKPPLCFTGHIDTVPLGAAEWSVDPFSGEIADGRLYGRGTTDMKSGVAAFVVAAAELGAKLDNTAGLVLVITAGEETGCEGAYHLTGVHGALGQAGAIVVAEPTSNRPYVGHKGALWLKAKTRGKTAHGSMPERGVNAVYKAARAISKLEDFDFNVARHRVLGGPTLNVGTVAGGMNVNSVPDLAEIGIDIRTVPGQDHAKVREHLTDYLGAEVEIAASVDVGGVWTDPNHPWMQDMAATVAAITGEPPSVATASYFTDASALTPAYGGPPTVILGPGEPHMAHQTDEYCLVDKIGQAKDVFIAVAAKWCGIA